MKCPYCGTLERKVCNTFQREEGVVRYSKCLGCGKKYYSIEITRATYDGLITRPGFTGDSVPRIKPEEPDRPVEAIEARVSAPALAEPSIPIRMAVLDLLEDPSFVEILASKLAGPVKDKIAASKLALAKAMEARHGQRL